MIYAYPMTFEEDEEGFWLVSFPDVPEAHTDDKDKAVAKAEAEDALLAALEGYIEARRPIPKPSRIAKGQEAVYLSPLVAAKVALYTAMRQAGFNAVTFAAQIGVSDTVVRRMLDLRHSSKIEYVSNALLALGKRLVVEVRDAA